MKLKQIDEALDSISRNFPGIDGTAKGVVYAIFHLSNEISRRGEQLLARHGISWGEYLALSTLRRDPRQAMSPSSIGDATGMTSGGVSNVLRRLETRGFVRRSRSTRDGRGVQVRLTVAGVKTVDEALPRLSKAESERMSHLSAADRKRLHQLLRALIGETTA